MQPKPSRHSDSRTQTLRHRSIWKYLQTETETYDTKPKLNNMDRNRQRTYDLMAPYKSVYYNYYYYYYHLSLEKISLVRRDDGGMTSELQLGRRCCNDSGMWVVSEWIYLRNAVMSSRAGLGHQRAKPQSHSPNEWPFEPNHINGSRWNFQNEVHDRKYHPKYTKHTNRFNL